MSLSQQNFFQTQNQKDSYWACIRKGVHRLNMWKAQNEPVTAKFFACSKSKRLILSLYPIYSHASLVFMISSETSEDSWRFSHIYAMTIKTSVEFSVFLLLFCASCYIQAKITLFFILFEHHSHIQRILPSRIKCKKANRNHFYCYPITASTTLTLST